MVDDELQREARALGDPTRHRLFRHIAEATEPVGVAELTSLVKLNHNAVRQHLAVLKQAGLVSEEIEKRCRPGRPRLLYRLGPAAAARWDTPNTYAWLAGLLSTVIRSRKDPRQVGRQDGLLRAAKLPASSDRVAALEGEITRRGFRPVRMEKGRRVDFVLGRCPFGDVASSDPDTICQLHLGLAEGLAEGLGGLEVERLVAKDPRRAGCRLVMHRLAPAGKDNLRPDR